MVQYSILWYRRSLGCTFAELMTGKILFKGANYMQMIKLIFDILGKPEEADLAEFIKNEHAQGFIDSLPVSIIHSILRPNHDVISLK